MAEGLLCRVVIAITFIVISYAQIIRVTCIGDSITQGGGCVPSSYTDVLQDMLGSDYAVFNAGASGQTMLKKGECNVNAGDPPSQYGDCSYWHTDAWKAAQTSIPDIVTIMLGTNDAKSFNWEGVQQDTGDYYALDFVSMINILRSLNPVPQIFLMVPPPLYAPYPWKMNATVINDIFPVLVRDVASVTQCGVIDVHSAFTNAKSQNLTCDGCHPTVDGNYLIADSIFTALKKL